jgi:hypothetical protein
MTTSDLLKYELEQVGLQIDRCIVGMSEAGLDTKCSPNGMTPREILIHFADCYEAFLAHARGEKYAWGRFKLEDTSTDNVRRVYVEARARAVEVALSAEYDHIVQAAYDYIIGHDNYHVGQLVLARMQSDPDWNADSIYG